MYNKIIRLKSFYHLPHLPREEIRQQSSTLKGAASNSILNSNNKIKLDMDRYNFFKTVLDYNKQVSNNIRNAEITQRKTIEAIQGLVSMSSLKGASIPMSSNNKVCKNGIFALKNLSRMISSNG